MSSFEELCQKLENLDSESFTKTFNALSADVLNSLLAITDGDSAVSSYLNFILASVSADGVLTKEEFNLIKPIFDQSAGHDVTYDEAVKMFNEMGLDDPSAIQDVVDAMVDIIGLVSPEIKDDIVLLCLMVCAIDGKVSDEEKEWIAQLVEPLTIELEPMEYIDRALETAQVFTLATVCRDQPKMRLLGFKTILDGEIYFGVGTHKDVYKQLQHNPKCELLVADGDGFIRWDGKAVFNDDQRLAMALGAAHPEIASFYIDNGLKFAFFTIAEGTAEIVSSDGSKTQLF